MVPGVDFDFGGGRVLCVAPLLLGHLQQFQGKMAALSEGAAIAPENVTSMLEIAHASLSRNYPEITLADVGELVDLGNMGDLIVCIMDVGGVERKKRQAPLTTTAASQS